MQRRHDMPFGASVEEDDAVRFRLWAPSAQRVELKLNTGGAGKVLPMSSIGDGWFQVMTREARAGSRYMYLIDGETLVPDPASRDQAGDVHGWSIVVDPREFDWRDEAWRGRPWEEAVIYELHVGTFTRSGSYLEAIERLDDLVELGVTGIELMPVAETPGERNWGYDGVYLFAPESSYGRRSDLKRLIEEAHRRGLMVFIDVVFNHFGPEGNYLPVYAAPFFTERHKTPWGAAINYDGRHSRVVRDFMIHNALYWLEEFHADGLRLDAVHAIIDDSEPNILVEIADTVENRITGRRVHLVLENDNNSARLLKRRSNEPAAYVAQWNDDVHHALHAVVTGVRDGYYADYGEPVEHLGRALTEGFSYQGERSEHRGGRSRGEPSRHLPPTAFVSFLQNHDQVGNNAYGLRITHIAPAEAVRAAVAIYLLAPSPPLLFMGEEWGASTPFPFFCDFGPDLADQVREGRRLEFARFDEFRDPAARERIPDPTQPATFAAAKIDWDERKRAPHREWLAQYRRLLAIRGREIVPRLAGISGNAAAYDIEERRLLRANWRLGDGSHLVLQANLSAQSGPWTNRAPGGELLFSTHPDQVLAKPMDPLPGWSVSWFLDRVRIG